MKIKWKERVRKPEKEKDGEEDKENHGSSEDESADGNSSNTDCDQDNDISFMKDTDEEIDTADVEEEEWIEYVKRRTDSVMERMKTAKIQCWIKTHRRLKWRLAMRIASLREERWVMKAAGTMNSARNTKQTAKDQEGWKKMENKFAMAAAAALGTRHQRRRRTVGCA